MDTTKPDLNMAMLRNDLVTVMRQKNLRKSDVVKKTGVNYASLYYFLTGQRKGLSGEAVLSLLPLVYQVTKLNNTLTTHKEAFNV